METLIMISNFEKIKFNSTGIIHTFALYIMPLNSAFPALLFPDFCPPNKGGFSRHPEGSRALAFTTPCAVSVADSRRPISHTLEGLRACSRAASCQIVRRAWWLHYVKDRFFLKVPEELRTTFKVETSTRAPVGFP